jgi:hypothetical protein
MSELLAEELRRLDPDDIYRETAAWFAENLAASAELPASTEENRPAGESRTAPAS